MVDPAAVRPDRLLAEVDIRAALTALRGRDPGFQYEVERAPPPHDRVSRIPRPVFDAPRAEDMARSVVRPCQDVAGRAPDAVGTERPISEAGTDASTRFGRHPPRGLRALGARRYPGGDGPLRLHQPDGPGNEMMALTALDASPRPAA